MDEAQNPEPAEGQIHAEDLVQPVEAPAEKPVGRKPLNQVAKEVLAGQWGRGLDRNKRLKDAGYDPSDVNVEVAKIINR